MGIDREYGEAFTPVEEDEEPHAGSGYDVDVLFDAAEQILHSVDQEEYWDDLVAATPDEAVAEAYQEALQEKADEVDERVIAVHEERELDHAGKRRKIAEIRDARRVLGMIDIDAYPEAEEAIERVREAYGDADAG